MTYKTDFPLLFLKQYRLEQRLELHNEECSFLFVLSGQITITFPSGEQRIYEANELTFLHSRMNYILIPGDSNIILHMMLKTEFLEKYVAPSHMIICDSVSEPNRNYLTVKRLLLNIADRYMDESASHELAIYGFLFQLANILLSEYTLKLPDRAWSGSDANLERIVQIQDFISQNYQQPITLNTLADHLHLTAQYLSRYFKNSFGINFNEYLNNLRIQHALHDILYSQKNITDIAIDHGFPNSSTFNRQFRKAYGLPPREYRKQHQNQSANTYEWSLLSKDLSHMITTVPENRRDISIEIPQEPKAFRHNFCDLINIGFARNLLTESFQNLLISAGKQLSFRYVRLEGLISNAVMPMLINSDLYYFKNVEKILNFLYEHNLIPFIELGKNSYDYFQSYNDSDKKNISSAPHYQGLRKYGQNKNFQHMLLTFLRVVRDLYDEEWTRQWKFEFWQTPGETNANYLEGYRALSSLVHEQLPGASFGGSGFNTIYGTEQLESLLHAFIQRGITPDFFSVHFFSLQYNPDALDGSAPMVSVANALDKQQAFICGKLQQIFHKKIPLYITEFNSSLLPDTYINESCFQAAFLCHNMLALHEASPLVGFWMLSDLAFSIEHPASYSSGGICLINRSGIRMPAFHAYCLMNRLGTTLIEKGTHYCVTKSEEDHFQILTYHYARFTGYDSLLEKEKCSLKDVYMHFESSPPVEMHFHLKGLTPGTYRVHRYLLNRSHGSLLDIQIGGLYTSTVDEATYLYKLQTPPPSQIEYLSNTCIPEERVIYLNIENQLHVDTTLDAHNVCLWDIVKEY